MKLILTQEVTGLGAPGDVVEVKDGYGRNYLLPRQFAIRWTRGAQREIDSIKRARSVRDIRSLEDAQQVADQLKGVQVRLASKVGDNGRLFGSVTAADIAAAVKDSGGPDLDKRRIEVRNPIKTAGRHEVSVRLHPEVSATLEFEVVKG
ncbi:50S ribosomal protein L9 [Allonocardiopsis opalescens]|uniref:Large ribosomal subunit protein bL9 n=1 Tax=Allonocardiopsis opalescens TaxID=1144618 RepID=A0A2T0Q6X9_9ACTN|nr:50S ribosomal protein L9 [Allonocardiopsis opalescens]PRX99541.1 LSU ribosomal protein L9P [Allonocardiopsis opalescens]